MVNTLEFHENEEKDIFILKETGHFPYFEDPEQLEEVFLKILKN